MRPTAILAAADHLSAVAVGGHGPAPFGSHFLSIVLGALLVGLPLVAWLLLRGYRGPK
ncbi:hypothetical protein [Streptomyces sp. TP-A0356]|uniref:hypothetical protein n=1 Tax=Streptomyces sp. TP-A0356 TaxID=1359208 RepID=UPI00131D6530|nr:hypothetical protein [Streptomyces sp. TP-A0356]